MTAECPTALSSSTIWKSSLKSLELLDQYQNSEKLFHGFCWTCSIIVITYHTLAPYLSVLFFKKENLKINLTIVLQPINKWLQFFVFLQPYNFSASVSYFNILFIAILLKASTDHCGIY